MSNAQGTTDPWMGLELDGRYRLSKKLGEGGMGVVYKAEHVLIGKAVAIKILRSEFAKSQDLVARFHQEARSASRIHHEHVVDITDFGKTPDGSAYFVMEYLEGCDLANLIENGPITYQRAIPIVGQVCSALHAAHEAGIIHRDLKPENIFLSSQHEHTDFVKILDFGIAKITQDGGDKLTRPGMIFGTPEYMSPEQAGGGELDRRVDIYALGIILYEMLTGEVPFQDSSFVGVLRKHMMAPVPSLKEYSNTPIELDPVLQQAMAKQPQDRFSSMVDLWMAVEEVLPEFAQLKKIRFENKSLGHDSRRLRSISPPQVKVATSERGRSISPAPDASGQRRASPVPHAPSAYRPAPSASKSAKPAGSDVSAVQKAKPQGAASAAKPLVSGAYKISASKGPVMSGGYAPQKPTATKPPSVNRPQATLLLAESNTLASYQKTNPHHDEYDDVPTNTGDSLEETLDLADFEEKAARKVSNYRDAAPTTDFRPPKAAPDFAASIQKEVKNVTPHVVSDFTQEPTRVGGLTNLPLKESPSGVQEEPTRIAISASLMQPALILQQEQPIQEQPTRMVSNPLETQAPVPFSTPQPLSSGIAQPIVQPKVAGLDVSSLPTEAAPRDEGSENGKKRLLVIALVMLFTVVFAVVLYWFVFRSTPTSTSLLPIEALSTPPASNVADPKLTTPITPSTPLKPENAEQDFPLQVKAIPALAKVFQGGRLLGDANDTITLRGKSGDKVKLTIKDELGEYKANTIEVTLGTTTATKMITLEKAASEPTKPTEVKKPVESKKPTDTKKPVDTKKPTEVKKPTETKKTKGGGIIDPFKK
jgi:serine/threonine protein kinase